MKKTSFCPALLAALSFALAVQGMERTDKRPTPKGNSKPSAPAIPANPANNPAPPADNTAPSAPNTAAASNRDPFLVRQPGDAAVANAGIEQPARNNVVLLVEYYSLPRLQARQWQAKLNEVELYKTVAEAGEAEKDGVTLENFIILRTRSGQRMRVESIAEFPYPTEFDPGQIPQTINEAAVKAMIKAANGGNKPAATVDSQWWPSTPASPTTFTVRNVGSSIEVEPVLSEDRKIVDLNLAPELIAFEGWEWMDDANEVPQPKFNTQKFTSAATLRIGMPSFVGTMSNSPHKKKDQPVNNRLVLVFVTPSLR